MLTKIEGQPTLGLEHMFADMDMLLQSICSHNHGTYRGAGDEFFCLEENCEHNTTGYKASDPCPICFDSLGSEVCLKNDCGHMFHLSCISSHLANTWKKHIHFNFLKCPLCRAQLRHCHLSDLINPHVDLYNQVEQLITHKIKADGLENDPERALTTNMEFGLSKYTFYNCQECNNPYCGGKRECAAMMEQEEEANGPKPDEKFVCPPCKSKKCDKHGEEYIQFKCRYCCSPSVWFCFGTTHFCEECHNHWSERQNTPKDQLPQCIGGPNCPLCIDYHPPNGDEFCMGCSMCAHEKRMADEDKEPEQFIRFLYFYETPEEKKEREIRQKKHDGQAVQNMRRNRRGENGIQQLNANVQAVARLFAEPVIRRPYAHLDRQVEGLAQLFGEADYDNIQNDANVEGLSDFFDLIEQEAANHEEANIGEFDLFGQPFADIPQQIIIQELPFGIEEEEEESLVPLLFDITFVQQQQQQQLQQADVKKIEQAVEEVKAKVDSLFGEINKFSLRVEQKLDQIAQRITVLETKTHPHHTYAEPKQEYATNNSPSFSNTFNFLFSTVACVVLYHIASPLLY